MEISGPVIKGRQYQDKVPTANILMEKAAPAGVYVGSAFDINGSLLGRSFVFITDYSPEVAETYITGYWGKELYGKFIGVEDMVKLDRDDMRHLYDNAMNAWEDHNVRAMP